MYDLHFKYIHFFQQMDKFANKLLIKKLCYCDIGGAVASWLVLSTPDRVVWFGAWPGTLRCVLGQDTLLSRCLSPPRCIIGYQRNAGGNPAMD